MPHYSVKLATYDPAIINAFDRLRKNRKQAAFTHEALKHFLSTEKGIQVLLLMEQKTTELSSAKSALLTEKIDIGIASPERIIAATSVDSSLVLDSILK